MKIFALILGMTVIAAADEPEKITSDEVIVMTSSNLTLRNARLAEENAKLAVENAELRLNMAIAQIRSSHKLLDGDNWESSGKITRKPKAKVK